MPKTSRPDTRPLPNKDWFESAARDRGTTLAKISQTILGDANLVGRSLRRAPNGAMRDLSAQEVSALAKELHYPVTEVLAQLGFEPYGCVGRVSGIVRPDASIDIFGDAARHGPEIVYPGEAGRSLVAVQAEDADALGAYRGAIFYYEPTGATTLISARRLSVIHMRGRKRGAIGVVGAIAHSREIGEGSAISLISGEQIAACVLDSVSPICWVRFRE